MAQGDVVVFNDALEYMFDGGWAGTDNIKIALLTSATAPTQADSAPDITDYTEVTPGGNYPAAGGQALNTWANMVTASGAVMTFDDTDAYVEWLQNGSNPNNARYGFIHNDDQGDKGIAYIDLGGVVDMTQGDLRITWHANGIFTVTNS